MSFILDALRKSESQRRLEAVPDIMRVPVAVGRNRVPPWTMVVIGVLTIAVAILAVTNLVDRGGNPTPVARAVGTATGITPNATPAPSTGSAAPTAVPIEPVVRQPRPAAPPPASAQPSQRTPGGAREPLAEPQIPVRTEPAVATTVPALPPSPPPARTPNASTDRANLPSAAALRAAGIGIPELDLQLLVTSATPASRLVVINGRRYREGDRLAEGPQIIEILTEGAVLRHASGDFLLSPN